MARTITPAITGALASNVQTPSIAMTISDPFDRPYDAIVNANAGRSAILQLGDGSYIRAYVNQPGLGNPAQVYAQLITDPTDATQLNTYNLRKSGAEGQAGIALALFGATIWLFYQRLSDHRICYQTSNDGTGWSAETVAANPGAHCWALTSAGNNDLFAAVNHSSDAAQEVIYYHWDGASWGAGSTWTNSPVQISGMSAVYQGGLYRIVLGAQSRTNGALALCSMTYSGSAWSGIAPILPIDDPLTGLSAPYPGLAFIAGTYHVTSVVYDDGTATGLPGQHAQLWTSPDFVHWHLAQTLAESLTNGGNPVAAPDGGWIVADAGTLVRSTNAAGAQSGDLDVSDRVLQLSIRERVNRCTTGWLTLANEDLALSPANPPGSALRVGAQVLISLGYSQSTVATHSLYVDRINFVNRPERASATLILSSRARLLKRQVHADRIFAGATILFLAGEIAVNGGIQEPPTTPGTAQFSQTVDSFSLHSQGTWQEALERLRDLYGFDWFIDEADQLQLREPRPADTSSWSYAATSTMGHSIQPRRSHNSVRVVGAGQAGAPPPFADAQDPVAQQRTGEVNHRLVADRLLATAAQCVIRAALEIRKGQRSAQSGFLVVALNPGHRLLDVIDIAAGTTTYTARINGIRWKVDLQSTAFQQIVELEVP